MVSAPAIAGPAPSAEARERELFCLREAGLPSVGANDHRHLEVVASGLAYQRGVPLAVDATVVSPLKATGEPRPGADKRAGLALRTAASTKRRDYKELVDSPVLRLVVAAAETGGRINAEAKALLAAAAAHRAQSEAENLRRKPPKTM